ncbi:MAG: TonB-dependent receptor [Bacteroides sp.]|nr:TonB-dependent receptor [Bacteroides sp.]
MKQITWLLGLFIFLALPASGQDRVIPGMHQNQLFTDFVEEMEGEYSLRFFYISLWVDSIRVVQSAPGEMLSTVLKQSLSPHGLYFYQEENQIFLSRNQAINPDLMQSFMASDSILKPEVSIRYDETTVPVVNSEASDRMRIIQIGVKNESSSGSNSSINGYIRESETGEPIIGAVIYNEDQSVGVTTDVNGYYVLSLPRGRRLIAIRSMGKKEEFRNVMLNGDGTLNIELEEQINQLKGVVITADKYQNVSGMQIGLNKIDVSTIKQVPAAMGEADVLKAALLLPGVQTVGEGASGFNVRGGSTDQNLIILNGAPVFNTSHLFGFFSAFNPDVVKDFKLYKSGITADYGGRISSVFDISTRNGNRKKFSVQGGISPITGRLVVEGPLVKEKVSFIAGIRTTYSDWILNQINDPSIRNSSAAFYDLNGIITYDINPNNNLNISAYYSKDKFRLNSDTSYHYANTNVVLGWKHIFSQKLFANFSGIYSSYLYDISSQIQEDQAFKMDYRIDQRELKAGFTWFPSQDHKVQFGLDGIFYQLDPGSLNPFSDQSQIKALYLEREHAIESALYISDEFNLSDKLTIYGGLRYSYYAFLGPKTVTNYYEGVPLDPVNIKDSSYYARGQMIQSYHGPEFRINLRYKLSGSSSIKLSYNRMRQYLNMLSNTTAVSPTDTWKLSDSHIRPQIGDQYALGFYKDFRKQNIETSVELYYKNIIDIIEYKGGANLVLNDAIEQDLINGDGRAYGIEIMVKRSSGKLNGWISYTYSRIMIKADSEYPVERINNGDWFPANHDKPHDVTLVGNYKFSRRFSISSNVTYSTGRPITYPVAKYKIRNMTMLHYTYRNEYRIPDYFRWDISANIEGNLKSTKLAHSSWSFSVYNVTGRDNVYSIYFVSKENSVNGYKLSIFSQPVFTVTYNFKF